MVDDSKNSLKTSMVDLFLKLEAIFLPKTVWEKVSEFKKFILVSVIFHKFN